MTNAREAALQQKLADGWHYNEQGKLVKDASYTVDKSGRDMPSQPPPNIRSDGAVVELDAYDTKWYDSAEIREHPLGIPESQPLSQGQLMYKSYIEKQKRAATEAADAAQAMRATLNMSAGEKRDYLYKHGLREKRLAPGNTVIVPDDSRHMETLRKQRNAQLAEARKREAEELAKRHTSDSIAVNQITRAVELLTQEEQERLLVGLLGTQRLAALEALAQQQEQSS